MTSRVDIHSSFWIGLALSVILIPLRWVFAWVIAAVVHELCHILLLWIFRCKLLRFKLSVFGATIESAPDSDVAAIICAAAGPVGSLLLIFSARLLPYLAICGFLQGAFNLLPLFPMDGWHILQRISGRFSKSVGVSVAFVFRIATCLVLVYFGVILFQCNCGPIPLIVAVTVICKDLKNSLQKRREEGTIVLLK